jgi:hypothetical protein
MKPTVLLLVGSSLLFLSGCGKEEPVSYVVPKEEPAAAPPMAMGSDADNAAVMAAHAAMTAQMPAGPGYKSTLPEGWTEVAGSGMRKASYTIAGTSIDFYLIVLSMGDVPSNVNRWRGQVGLPAAEPEAIAQDVQAFQAGGHDVSYIEIYNDEGGKGIIAAIVDLSPSYWYFTAKGSVDELKAHASEIRGFLESLEIN